MRPSISTTRGRISATLQFRFSSAAHATKNDDTWLPYLVLYTNRSTNPDLLIPKIEGVHNESSAIQRKARRSTSDTTLGYVAEMQSSVTKLGMEWYEITRCKMWSCGGGGGGLKNPILLCAIFFGAGWRAGRGVHSRWVDPSLMMTDSFLRLDCIRQSDLVVDV